jgi:hypothetical protein
MNDFSEKVPLTDVAMPSATEDDDWDDPFLSDESAEEAAS